MTDKSGYCRDCRTQHGPWGHLNEVLNPQGLHSAWGIAKPAPIIEAIEQADEGETR